MDTMNKVVRTAAFMLMMILFSIGAQAQVLITQVLYDPEGTDAGKEWLEIYNTGTEAVSLEGYQIFTGNGAGEDQWRLEWTGTTEYINGNGYFLIGEEDSMLEPDVVINNIDLQNGPDGVKLVKDSEIIDLVGWGVHTYDEYYLGSPTPLTGGGKSLLRIKDGDSYVDTRNNHNDFIVAEPSPRNSKVGGMTSLAVHLVVLESSAEIRNISIEDHDPFQEGVQIIPFAGRDQAVAVSATVAYTNCSALEASIDSGLEETRLALDSENGGICTFSGNMTIPFSTPPGEYEAMLQVTEHGVLKAGRGVPYTLNSVTGIALDSKTALFNMTKGGQGTITGDTDLDTPGHPTIRNIGNVPIEIFVSGTPLVGAGASIDISSLIVLVDGKGGPLSLSPSPIGVYLASGQLAPVDITVAVPTDAQSGTYQGTISLLAKEVE